MQALSNSPNYECRGGDDATVKSHILLQIIKK